MRAQDRRVLCSTNRGSPGQESPAASVDVRYAESAKKHGECKWTLRGAGKDGDSCAWTWTIDLRSTSSGQWEKNEKRRAWVEGPAHVVTC